MYEIVYHAASVISANNVNTLKNTL